MPTYFRKTIKLLPWVTLNLNKTGGSLSIGPRGAKINISKKGVYFNSSIPGTGVSNKTKIGTSLLWALGTLVAMVAAGYGLGVTLQNFNLFVGICIAAIPAAIAAFLISKHYSNTTTVTEDDEELELPAEMPKRRTGRTATKRTTSSQKSGSKGGTTSRSTSRTSSASAKAYIGEVEKLMIKMAEAGTLDELNKAHSEILDIMYTNIKPLNTKVFGLDFDQAILNIQQEYAEGVRQITGDAEEGA